MPTQTVNQEVRSSARLLAAVEAEPTMQRAYLFPSEEEIRLIYADPKTPPMWEGDLVAPFYFAPDCPGGICYPYAIALIRPEEIGRFDPPEGWGDWKEAEVKGGRPAPPSRPPG